MTKPTTVAPPPKTAERELDADFSSLLRSPRAPAIAPIPVPPKPSTPPTNGSVTPPTPPITESSQPPAAPTGTDAGGGTAAPEAESEAPPIEEAPGAEADGGASSESPADTPPEASEEDGGTAETTAALKELVRKDPKLAAALGRKMLGLTEDEAEVDPSEVPAKPAILKDDDDAFDKRLAALIDEGKDTEALRLQRERIAADRDYRDRLATWRKEQEAAAYQQREAEVRELAKEAKTRWPGTPWSVIEKAMRDKYRALASDRTMGRRAFALSPKIVFGLVKADIADSVRSEAAKKAAATKLAQKKEASAGAGNVPSSGTGPSATPPSKPAAPTGPRPLMEQLADLARSRGRIL